MRELALYIAKGREGNEKLNDKEMEDLIALLDRALLYGEPPAADFTADISPAALKVFEEALQELEAA